MKNLFKALAEFQNEVPVIHQNTKGYNYTYADLHKIFEVIKPLLKKHGLGFTQYLDGNQLFTVLFHIESGESLDGCVDIPKVNLKGQNEFQALGSGITYLRRYSLSCMLGLITDKDADAQGEQIKPNLVLNSKQFHGGITKKTPLEVMRNHFTISDQVAEQYQSSLDCDAAEVDTY